MAVDVRRSPQFLDATWPAYGTRKTPDPRGQIAAGLTYIDRRYGSPCAAWSFWWAQKARGGAPWY